MYSYDRVNRRKQLEVACACVNGSSLSLWPWQHLHVCACAAECGREHTAAAQLRGCHHRLGHLSGAHLPLTQAALKGWGGSGITIRHAGRFSRQHSDIHRFCGPGLADGGSVRAVRGRCDGGAVSARLCAQQNLWYQTHSTLPSMLPCCHACVRVASFLSPSQFFPKKVTTGATKCGNAKKKYQTTLYSKQMTTSIQAKKQNNK